MAVRIRDLQVIYGLAGAREKFEDLTSDLIHAEHSAANALRYPAAMEGSISMWAIGHPPSTFIRPNSFPPI